MKAALCVLLLATALVYGAEEKKNEKRGVLGLGYGFGHAAPLVGGGYYGQGLGLYNHGAGLGYGHGAGLGYGHGVGLGYGHGLGLGHGYYGHSIAAAPLVSHGVYSAAPVHYGAPLLGLGHGYGLGHGFGLGHGYLH